MQGLKRLFDSQALYAQLVVTSECNLTCSYCNEYTRGAQMPSLSELKRRAERLSALGVMVFDLLGGEPLLHKNLVPLIRYIKSLGRGDNIVILITNGFLLTASMIEELNETGLDMMQISVDSPRPTVHSEKALSLLLPKLKILKEKARFKVKVQSVLTEQTGSEYGEFRALMKGLPFDFGFSLLHGPGGRVAIKGEEYVRLLRDEGLFAGMNLYRSNAEEALLGDFSRPWKCLGGSKFLYVNNNGDVQFCSQNSTFRRALGDFTTRDIKANNRHKTCEAGCVLGCARLISHALGEPFKTMKTSLSLLGGFKAQGQEARKETKTSWDKKNLRGAVKE